MIIDRLSREQIEKLLSGELHLTKLILQLGISGLKNTFALSLPIYIVHECINSPRDCRFFLRLEKLEGRKLEIGLLNLLPQVVQLFRQNLSSCLKQNNWNKLK